MALDGFRYARVGTPLLAIGGARAARESHLSEHLPSFSFAGRDVMVLREGDLMATLRLDGLNPLTTPDSDLDALKRAVASVIAQSGNAFGFYIHRLSVPQDLSLPPVRGCGLGKGNDFAAAIVRRWQAHIAQLDPKKKQLYLSIIRRPDLSARVPILNGVARRVWTKDRETRIRELNDVVGFFQIALGVANPVRLTNQTGEWLGFLSALLSGQYMPIAPPQTPLPLAHCLGTCRATFGNDCAILTCAITGQTRYGALFSIKSYPALTDIALLDGLDLPLDVVLTNSFSPIPTNIMAERIQRIVRQMRAADDAAVSLRDQLLEAADDQEAGRIAFGDHHLSIAVYAPDRNTLEQAAAEIKRLGQESMAVIVRETMALKAGYFAQIPGNFGYRARKTPISTVNFADFSALHGSVAGRPGKASPWGTPITVFPTTGTAGYRFNFHEPGIPDAEPSVGHTLMLGRTGSGKTLMAGFLAAQARRVGARLFLFDKDRGLEMAIRALGGHYSDVRAGLPTGLRPLETETDDRGCAWLADWLTALLTRSGDLTGAQSRHLQHAIQQNADAGPSLQNFASFQTLFQSLDDDGDLELRVAEWAPGGRFGWVFAETPNDAEVEISGEIVGFDMTEIMDLSAERMAVLSYIFRRIERTVEDRQPTIIVLDEAWKLLDDRYFGARLENWLVTLRKMNCVVVMMTQYPSQLRETQVGKTIVETVPTQILFPNDRATPEDYAFLRVNEKEAVLLTQPTSGQRIALIRSAGESVFVDVDLSQLGPLLPILGGGRSGEARVGPDWRQDPDFWRASCD